MKSGHEAHLYYWLAALSSALGWVFHGWLSHSNLLNNSSMLPFAEIASPAVVFASLLFLFDRFGWKMDWLCRILKVPHLPDLNGEWKVKGISSYEDPQTGKGREWEGKAIIHQQWSKLSIFLKTEHSSSISQVAVLWEEGPFVTLLYDYMNEPAKDAVGTMAKHRGTSRLLYRDGILDGNYYTETRERGTDGSMIFTKA